MEDGEVFESEKRFHLRFTGDRKGRPYIAGVCSVHEELRAKIENFVESERDTNEKILLVILFWGKSYSIFGTECLTLHSF